MNKYEELLEMLSPIGWKITNGLKRESVGQIEFNIESENGSCSITCHTYNFEQLPLKINETSIDYIPLIWKTKITNDDLANAMSICRYLYKLSYDELYEIHKSYKQNKMNLAEVEEFNNYLKNKSLTYKTDGKNGIGNGRYIEFDFYDLESKIEEFKFRIKFYISEEDKLIDGSVIQYSKYYIVYNLHEFEEFYKTVMDIATMLKKMTGSEILGYLC